MAAIAIAERNGAGAPRTERVGGDERAGCAPGGVGCTRSVYCAGMALKTRWVAILSFVVALSVWVGVEVHRRLIEPAPPLNFDEAAHSLEGYYILRDILRLDVRELWVNFHVQTLWPPGFSLMQAPFLLALGVTDASARIFAFIMLVATVLLGFVVARLIDPDLAPVAGLIAALFSLTSPGWLFTASWANQETPVAFVVFAAFAVFLAALQRRTSAWFAAAGLTLFALFLTKYNYAAFALASVGLVDIAIRARRVRRGEDTPGTAAAGFLALFAPFAAGLLFWFFAGQDVVKTEIKWRDFAFFVSNEDSGYPFWSEQNLLFYVRATAEWLMAAPVIAASALAGAGYAVVRVKRPGAALLAAFFGVGFALATVHQLKAPRYIAPLFPSLWLLAGLGAADVWRRFGRRRLQGGIPLADSPSPIARSARIAVAGVPFLVAMWSLAVWLPQLKPVWHGDVARGLRAAADTVVAWQSPVRPLLIVGTFGELGPPYFEWRFRPVAAFADSGAPIQYDAPPGTGSDLERVIAWAQANPGAQITTIRVAPGTPLYETQDMKAKNEWKQRIVDGVPSVPGYRQVQERVFPEAGLTVRYFLPIE